MNHALAFDTCRLQLRALQDGDQELFCQLYTDPETMKFIMPALSPQRAIKAFRAAVAGTRRDPPECLWWTILDRSSGQHLGLCGVPRFARDIAQVEIGLILAEGARSRGYANEAFSGLIECCFETLGVQEAWVQFSRLNLGMQRLVDRAGLIACVEPDAAIGTGLRKMASIRRSEMPNHEKTESE